MKTFIFGNAGSGKTTLLKRIKETSAIELFSIDDFRRKYGDGSINGEKLARLHFLDQVCSNKDQVIECTGIGEVALSLFRKVEQTDERILIITLLVPAEICKKRLTNRVFDVPYPKPPSEIGAFVDRTELEIQKGFIGRLWGRRAKTAIRYGNNIDPDDLDKIADQVLCFMKQEGMNINEFPSTINTMLSPEIQRYYSEEYEAFQGNVNEQNILLVEDRTVFADFLLRLTISGNLLDIGSGNCQWYPFLKDKVTGYFAMDVNEAALGQLRSEALIKTIHADIFAEECDLRQLTGMPMQIGLFSFFFSHFSDDDLHGLLKKLVDLPQLIIIDSYWSTPLKAKHLVKDLREVRRNTVSRRRIAMPKRFFEMEDISRLLYPYGYEIADFNIGNYWFCCLASKRQTQKTTIALSEFT